MRVLIDGHNAIHRLKLRGPDHASLRRLLLVRVAEREPQAIVFFDAREVPPGLFGHAREGGIRVEYVRGRDADSAILDEVRDGPDALVVSDDRELAGRARQLGARACSVREFFGAEPPREKPRGRLPRRMPPMEPKDFGLPDEVDLRKTKLD